MGRKTQAGNQVKGGRLKDTECREYILPPFWLTLPRELLSELHQGGGQTWGALVLSLEGTVLLLVVFARINDFVIIALGVVGEGG